MTALHLKSITKGSTYILKLVVIALGILAITLGGLLLYAFFTSDDVGAYKPIVIGMVLMVVPFLLGLFESFKILNYISKKTAFSDLSVKALKKIKTYAFVISGFYTLSMPYIYYVAERDDAPGVILIGMVFIVAPFVIAVFAAILQELMQNAIELKSENDLTI